MFLKKNRVPVHFPVEGMHKATKYRQAVRGLAVVRESAFSLNRFLTAKHEVSIAVGRGAMRERWGDARKVAQLRRDKTGRDVVVCPYESAAIVGQAGKAVCESCGACALPKTDIVFVKTIESTKGNENDMGLEQ